MSPIVIESQLAQFLKKFEGQIRIAPLGMNIHVLMRALSDGDMDQRQLASVLHHYPVITARLIALANSAWISPAFPITNIEAACIRLGMSVVRGISIAIAVASSFNVARCPAFDPIRFWATSMLVAEGAGLLVAELPDKANYAPDFVCTAQTGGILHNLGLLWLADNLAVETAEALNLVSEDPLLTVNDALEQCISINYCLAGAWIGNQWQMPEELIAVMQHHRDNSYQENPAVLVLLVGAAAKMVSSMFHENHEMADNQSLHNLGIDLEQQSNVFKQLAKKFDSTCELAKALFL